MLAAEANTFCGPFAGGSLLYMSLKNYLWRAVVYSYDTKPRRLRRFTDNRCLIGKHNVTFHVVPGREMHAICRPIVRRDGPRSIYNSLCAV